MKCSVHKDVDMGETHTKYGVRHTCFVPGCTMVGWGGETSSVADYETRQARREAHAMIRPLFNNKKKRARFYKTLAEYMNIPGNKCHIGMFNKEQCEKVIEFARHTDTGDSQDGNEA